MTKSEIFASKLIGGEPSGETGKAIYKNTKRRMSQLSEWEHDRALLAFCKASGCSCTNNIVCQKYKIFKDLITE